MNSVVVPFQFLRPEWLWLLPLLPALAWWVARAAGARAAWQRAVDAHLLPHLLQAGTRGAGRATTMLLLAAPALAIVALAGPSWREARVPLWQMQAPLVIAFDLSSAMRATDLAPSRLVQARARVAELLSSRRGGQVGLLAFAGDAFTVAPITRDARTISALLDSLDPSLMPVDGQRADRAIDRAVEMLRSAGFVDGDVLLVSDHADADARAAAQRAQGQGVRVSALGVGTAAGAPASGRDGFLTGANGAVLLARLDAPSLGALAQAGGGRYAALRPDGGDLRALGLLDPQGRGDVAGGDARAGASGAVTEASVQRSDDGYWLLPPVLLLTLFGFRRGWLAMLPLALALATMIHAPGARAAGAVEAVPPSESDSLWAKLWQRDDQRAHAALARGDAAQARRIAPDAATRGAADFRANDFAAAEREWAKLDSADAHYNRGNALAKAGKLEQALGAYDAALAQAPDMADAQANRKLVADALKRQQQPQSGSQQQDPKTGDQGEQQQGQQQAQKQDQKQGSSEKQDSPRQGEQGKDQHAQQPSGDGKQPDGAKPDAQPARDAAAEQAAKDAAKRDMQQALDQQAQAGARADGKDKANAAQTAQARETAEQQQALQQWLKRVPDDPGSLLQRKFQLEYQRRRAQGNR